MVTGLRREFLQPLAAALVEFRQVLPVHRWRGGEGVGYGAPAAVGAALANRKHGRFSVAIQNDGDLLFAPGVLWTAAHHQIPLLSVMHNNRAYHQEVMHIQRMADRRQRGIERAAIGTALTHPNIDFAKIAQGMGIYAEGPITDPKDLAPPRARGGRGQARRAGAGGRGYAAALKWKRLRGWISREPGSPKTVHQK